MKKAQAKSSPILHPEARKLRAAVLEEVWSQLVPKLEEVKRRCGNDWTVEAVYARIFTQQAFLYVAPEGFVILTPRINFDTNEKELMIWIAYGIGNDLGEHYYPQIEEIARALQMHRVTAISPRKGIGRLPGWESAGTVYRKKVHYPT